MKTILDGVLHMTLAGSLVILAVLLAWALLRKAPKRFSYALWVVVLVRLLCPVELQVEIHQGDFGMARIPAEDQPGHFYRVPAISFRGQGYAKDKETGEMVELKTVNGGTLVTINAMDGTVIG